MPITRGTRADGTRPSVPLGAIAALSGVASVVGFLLVLEFASGLTQGWLSPLLPSILQRYDTAAASLNWVNAVYLLSSAVCVPLLSKLGDRYGHRRFLVVAAVSVAVGSVLVAVAPTFEILLLGRAVQGPLAAFLSLEFAIVRERAGSLAGRAIGLIVGALALGGSAGLLLSGVARQHLSLSATLWIPAALMILMVPVAALLVPETTLRTTGRLDWAGAALLSAGLVLLLAAVGNGSGWGWTDARTVGGIAGGLTVLAVWVRFEQRVAYPFVDVSLLMRGGLGLPVLAGLFAGAELFGSQAASALYLGLPASTGVGLGLTVLQLGLVLLAFGLAAFAGTWLAPRLSERAGSRTALAVGALLTAAGYVLTALAHDAVATFVIWQVMVGVGNGLVLATLSTYVVTLAPADAVGISSGLLNTARTVGGAVSGAAFAALMAALSTHVPGVAKPVTVEAGYVTVWLACAALVIVVAALAFRLPANNHDPEGRRGR
ncbi:MFS transporter [Actinoplanes solisilvae]|uniref:MFS transporter n=1 Tax=Actinoplanes solisilvae TaxID=2486853 RepID=UPI0013E319BB|nr:MFS transporter [Actinoplanes solisilvae]